MVADHSLCARENPRGILCEKIHTNCPHQSNKESNTHSIPGRAGLSGGTISCPSGKFERTPTHDESKTHPPNDILLFPDRIGVWAKLSELLFHGPA
jgi:hypothetical protein